MADDDVSKRAYERIVEAQEHRKAGRSQKAAECYREVTRQLPDFHEAWVNLGAVLNELGQLEEALRSLNKALDLKPEDPMAWFNKGSTQAMLQRYGEALASYRQAINLDPNFAEPWAGVGKVLGAQNQMNEALGAFQRAARLGDEPTRRFLEAKGLLGDPKNDIKIQFGEAPHPDQATGQGTCEGKSIGIGIPFHGRPCANDAQITVEITDLDSRHPVCKQCFEEIKILFSTMPERIEKKADGHYVLRVT